MHRVLVAATLVFVAACGSASSENADDTPPPGDDVPGVEAGAREGVDSGGPRVGATGARPDAAASDGAARDSGSPDSRPYDASTPDSGRAETSTPDSGRAETSTTDSGIDGGPKDAAVIEGGGRDAAEGGNACVPESDVALCARLAARCGVLTGADNCGVARSVASCGTCSSPLQCGAAGVANQCGEASVTMAEEVAAPDRGGASVPVIRFDAAGELHAVYVDLTDGDLFHAWRDASGWRRERAMDSGPDKAVVQDVAFDGSDALHVLVAVVSGASPNAVTSVRHAVRSSQGQWSSAPFEYPAGLSQKTSRVVFERGAVPVVLTMEASGQPSPSDCRFTRSRRTASGWLQGTVTTYRKDSYGAGYGCSYPYFTALDSNGRALMALQDYPTRGRYGLAVENAQGSWDLTTTPLSSNENGGSKDSGRVLIGADGTIHLWGVSALSNQPRYMYGSGIFWSEEQVTGVGSISAFPLSNVRMDLSASGDLLFAQMYTGSASNARGVYARIYVARARRTGANTFVALPVRTVDPVLPVGASSSNRLSTTMFAVSPEGEPVIVADRGSLADGRGLDLTDWPSGNTRTVELDWQDAVRPLDVTFDRANMPHALVAEGEWYYGLSRLVVRSRTASRWTSGAAVLPDGLGNGNGQYSGRLRIGADGRKRVLVVGTLAANVSGLVLATEDANGAWQREHVAQVSKVDALDLTIDASGAAHVTWEQNGNLYYARRGASGFTTETAVLTAVSSSHTNVRIVVDAAGTPYLGYVRDNGYSLGFARRANGLWQATSFAYDGNGNGFGLGLDGQGRPCMAHVVTPSSGYAQLTLDCLAGGSFQSAPIDTSAPKIWNAGTDAMGRFTLIGEGGGFQGVPTIYTQGANGWAVEKLSSTWPTERPFFAVAPSGAPGFLVKVDRRLMWRTR